MKVFLSAIEIGPPIEALKNMQMLYNLMSYYYIRKQKREYASLVRDHTKEILIDSGAHSFQKGAKVDWVKYTQEYAEFIKEFDRPNVLGYFEMDVDNVLGYEKVLELRKPLEAVSDKIIPVWHRNRGIEDFKKMCQQYSGRIVAVTGFKNEDIRDEQYLMFLKYAHKFGCKLHCLGMTRKKILDTVPFDYVDSSSWKQQCLYGSIGGKKVNKEYNKGHWAEVFQRAYIPAMEMQKHYEMKWRGM